MHLTRKHNWNVSIEGKRNDVLPYVFIPIVVIVIVLSTEAWQLRRLKTTSRFPHPFFFFSSFSLKWLCLLHTLKSSIHPKQRTDSQLVAPGTNECIHQSGVPLKDSSPFFLWILESFRPSHSFPLLTWWSPSLRSRGSLTAKRAFWIDILVSHTHSAPRITGIPWMEAEDSNLLSREKRCISISSLFEIAEVLQSMSQLHFCLTFKGRQMKTNLLLV